MLNPNCYECKYQKAVPGDAHISCIHPKIGGDNISNQLIALLFPDKFAKKLNIIGNEYGIKKGWFAWPVNFDPVWLESCDGFEKKGE